VVPRSRLRKRSNVAAVEAGNKKKSDSGSGKASERRSGPGKTARAIDQENAARAEMSRTYESRPTVRSSINFVQRL
jgi:hypothetical protein